MDHQRRSLRLGAAAIGCAILLRLISSGFFDPLIRAFQQPEVASFLLYLETGRVVRPAMAQEIPPDTLPAQTDPPRTTVPKTVGLTFAQADADLITVKNSSGYEPDMAALLQTPLNWDLTGEGPRVLILHTHATESYTKTAEDYEESSAYRTLDEGYNMLAIGERLASLLEAAGIQVLHDRTLHDYPSYNGSYENARATIQTYLAQYPTIELVLDLHRDAAEDEDGNQIASTVWLDGTQTAQLMLVLGTDAGGLTHPNWQSNLALAAKLHATLEKQDPGICRSLRLTDQRYNQDLLPGTLLVEVGAAGNTHAQAYAAIEALAEAVKALAAGSS